MKILAVESSAKAASAALWEEGRLLSEAYVRVGLTHSQTLLPMVQSVLQNAGISIQEVDGFAAAHGPGSFTGIRIGVAAVKGMAQGCEKPCCGISTLEALARNVGHLSGTIVPLMDARCSQYYVAFFSSDGTGPVRLSEDEALTHEELSARLAAFPGRLVFVGDGAELCYNKLEESDRQRVVLAPEALRFARASSVAAAAEPLLLAGGMPPEKLAPQYLRLPQAERERLKKQG